MLQAKIINSAEQACHWTSRDLGVDRVQADSQALAHAASPATDPHFHGTGMMVASAQEDLLDPLARDAGPAFFGELTIVDDVMVTGSLIRGVGDGPSPVVSIDRDRMDRDGRATVAQLLAALPQNFGGTANEAALNNGGDRSGTNSTYANGVNLRGPGSDATLVLINGRRMAGTGAKGDFADVSSIPTAAIRRVDVLLDGASALYGADAVGGVVNIILRDDYDGAETRIRVGNTSDGASGEYQFGQTFGRRWSSGNALLTYEYNDREALSGTERRLASDSDLRWRGGSDRRQFYSNPGNIVVFDPVSGGYLPAWAIPPGQSGVGLRPGDFLPGQVNLENHRAGINVLPRQTRHSGYALWRQNLGDRLEITADARYGKRNYETVSFPITTLLTVTDANPYFASPTGARSHTIAYSFQGEIAPPRIFGEVESIGASLGGGFDLPRDWRVDAYVAWASEESRTGSSGALQSTYLREALGAIADNPATAFSPARDGYLNPFGDGAVNTAAVLDFISSGYSRARSRSGVASANFQISGALMELPGGPLRLATGLSLREETFKRQSTGFSSGLAPTVGAGVRTERQVAAAFGEVRLPVFGADNRRPGFERLELSLAARFEDYGDAGHPGPSGESLTSWLLLPPGANPGERLPVVVEVYPGTAPRSAPSALLPGGTRLQNNPAVIAAAGYAVLIVSLPLEPGESRPAAGIADRIPVAVDAAGDLGLVDPGRVALIGHSFGAYGVLSAVAQSDRFSAVIASNGYPDLSLSMQLPPFFRVAPEEGVPIGRLVGWGETGQASIGDFAAAPQAYVEASPLYQAEAIRTPALLIESDLDTQRMSTLFSALYRRNREAGLLTYFGEGHAYASPGNLRDLHARIIDWLTRYLGPP